MTDSHRPAGARSAPAAPFLVHVTPAPGLHVAYTGVDAGNLAFHVTGGDPQGPGTAPSDAETHGAGVTAARRRLEEAMGVPHGRTEYLDQVHSARVVPARGRGWADRAAAPEQADAIVSATGRDPLAIMVADCLPVVFASRAAGAADSRDPGAEALTGPTAVAHAGRRGLLDGVLEATVARMRAAGAGTGHGDIQAWIGPGICGRCYEVPEDMMRDGAERIPETSSRTSWGTPALDLPAGAAAVLGPLGVRVHRVDRCTYEDELLYSHRRAPGRGRFTGLVWREGPRAPQPLAPAAHHATGGMA